MTENAFDGLNRVTRITQQGIVGPGTNAVAEKRVDFAYLADGRFDEIQRYADLAGTDLVAESAFGYDGAGRLTSLAHAKGMTTFAGYGWTHDAANRITAFTNSEYSAEDVTYAYDDSGQLIGADRTGSGNDESYDYDDNGNRETANGDTYSTTANNRMSSDGTFDYTYDDEGNTLTKTRISSDPADDKTVEYTWDHRNRLTAVTFKNNAGAVTQKVEYVYDAFDRYIVRRHDMDGDTDIDETLNFIYDGEHIALALAPNGDVQNRYLQGPAIDMVLADEQVGGDVLWTLADNQGTLRDLASYDAGLDETTVENHRTFNSFGKITAETNAAVDHLFAYTGRILDETTGDQNNRARWYDSDSGRWLNEDPIGFNGDMSNLRRYVYNSPTNWLDPRGLQSQGLGELGDILGGIAQSDAAKAEAQRIAAAIKNTWDYNGLSDYRINSERAKGYYCYEWAYGFEDTFKLESSGKYFKVETGGTAMEGVDPRVHVWIKITSLETGKSIYVDDAFGNGSQVNSQPPIPEGYGKQDWVRTWNPRAECDNIPKAYKSSDPPPPKPKSFWEGFFEYMGERADGIGVF